MAITKVFETFLSLVICVGLVGVAGTIEAETITQKQSVSLSREFSGFVTASKPGRAGDMSAISPDGSMRLDSYLGGNALVLSAPDGRIIAETVTPEPVVRVLFGAARQPVSVGQDGVISIWPDGFDGAAKTVALPVFAPFNVQPGVTTAIPLWVGTSVIAIGGWRGARGLYDIESGEKRADLMYDTQSIDRFVYSPDGAMVAAIQGGSLVVYRAKDGAFLGQYDWMEAFNGTGSEQITDAAFSSDGKIIHATHFGGAWREMEIATNEVRERRWVYDTGRFALGPDDQQLAAFRVTNNAPWLEEVEVFRPDAADAQRPGANGCEDQRAIAEYDGAENGYRIRVCLVPRTMAHPEGLDPVWQAYPIDFAFSPDGTRLAAVTGGGRAETNRLIIWDVATGQAIMDYGLGRTPTEFDDLQGVEPVFSPDGTYVSVAFPDHHALSLPATLDGLRQAAVAVGAIQKTKEN